MDSSNQLKLYSLSEAAKVMGIGRDSLRNLIADGKIGTILVGNNKKISHQELIRFQLECTERKLEIRAKSYSEQDIEQTLYRKNKIRVKSIGGEEILNRILREDQNGYCKKNL
ncbi:helix-turn-helix domain-containing protein [Clostridium sp.]|uniref:helix-turn-helix domain-containing protein n=1 Tax=Clostridium sp. TaxID=1506 RepID=UPI00284854A1|nr:helix-turn-helix domain-containing protein [Clostridium sp.]MDR3593428.1 helix-turn-helix domain-containing protein [Clostridium sp.]